jgi:uncharacterized alpha-E superfamily protein
MTAHDQVITEARHCAELFRLGRDIEAALRMVELIEAAMPVFASRTADQRQQWAQVLSAILACQERQDWLGLADWLGGEFVELCERG